MRTIRPTRRALIDEFEATFHRAVELQASGRRARGRLSLRRRRFGLCARHRCQGARHADPELHHQGAAPRARRGGECRGHGAAPSAAPRPWSRPAPIVIAETYAALIRAAESPVLDTSCAALLALSREVHAQGYKAVLTGEGADEGFRRLCVVQDQGGGAQRSISATRFRAEHRHQPLRAEMGGARHQLRRVRAHRRHDRRPARPVHPLQSRGDVARRAITAPSLKERLGDFVAYQDLALDLRAPAPLASAEPLALSRLQDAARRAAADARRATASPWPTASRRATRFSTRT